ncbi:AlpA family transcriptional regulator [Pseudoxanthomonas sp.]|uniref:helix-turn-helix transcriptional regulator n=1 Tax=Pseudoxanthomonas sp. TaxID=1871049 RepID=UPI0031F323E1
MSQRLIRLPAVIERTGLSKSAIYRRAGAGTFPRPVPLGHSMSGWVECEIDQWITDRIRDRDEAGQEPG